MSVIMATDGEIGHVDQFLFDDENWSIRYLVVKTKWLMGRRVLVSPLAIVDKDVDLKFIWLSLTRKQIEQSPNIDTDKPVSRQMEALYHDYYRWPYYWTGSALWVVGPENGGDSHLRAAHVVEGYKIAAEDGVFGHVEDFIVDDESWSIRYLVINTYRKWPGKSVLLSPDWVDSISWSGRSISINLTQEKIKNCPEYTDDVTVDRQYEERLYNYYGHPRYWAKDTVPRFAAARKSIQ